MASNRASIKVQARDEFGSRSSRRLRREGLVPGIVYGSGGDARPFQVPERDMRILLSKGHTLVDLELDGAASVPVVIKEEQRHPVRGELIHIDCHEVDLKEKIESEVPVELEGSDQAPGVREGGVLEHVTRTVTVETLPTEIPEHLSLDVSEMIIGDTYSLARVTPPAGVTFTADDLEEITIATLSPPRIEEEPEPEVEEDPELVGEEGEGEEGEGDGEESAEGDSGSGDSGDSSDGGGDGE